MKCIVEVVCTLKRYCSSFPGWWRCGRPYMSSVRLGWIAPEYWVESLLQWPHLVVEAAGMDWKIESWLNTFSNRTCTDLSNVAVRVQDHVGSLCQIQLLFIHRTGSVWILRVLTIWSHHEYLKAVPFVDIGYDEMWFVLIILAYF